MPQKLKITAIVGGKRHHTRFYPIIRDDENADRRGNGNCLPGTLVDQVVTSPDYRDVYLQLHSGIIGTVMSTHYFVIKVDSIRVLNPTESPIKGSGLILRVLVKPLTIPIDSRSMLCLLSIHDWGIIRHAHILRRPTMRTGPFVPPQVLW